MNIGHILRSGFHDARAALVMGTSAASLARARERAFAKTVASQLQEALFADDIRVFSAYSRGNKSDFGTEQLIYEIEACRVAKGNTADRLKEPFAYVTSPLWQIEIEFSREWHDAVYAVNRLCCGSAESKLLITAQRSGVHGEFIDTLKTGASHCSGNFYLALVPHPQDWDDSDGTLDIWQLDDDTWRTVS